MRMFGANILHLMQGMISIFFLILGYSYTAQAATGWCTPVNGTQFFSYIYNRNITNPEDNKAGVFIDDPNGWNLGGNYPISCDCDSSTLNTLRVFKAEVPSLPSYNQFNGKSYFSIDSYLAVAIESYLGGNKQRYQDVPFNNIDTGVTQAGCNSVDPNADTGSRGRISLYIKKPFVGQVIIPSTPILQVFASKLADNYPGIPISQVNISGVITVPQSCEINSGQVINIDYGPILNTAIKTKGAKPLGFTEHVTELSYICTNVSEGVKLSFTFNGIPSNDDSNSLATTNENIGVRVENSNGETITPNLGELSAQYDYAINRGSTSFKSYPVNTTGQVPETGSFSTQATITINME